MNENGGRWVTINGAHVFLKDGQSPMDAFIRQKGKSKKNFSNSKVVDENGNLLKMYHGSTTDFENFDINKIREVDYDVPYNGFWFSSDENTSPAMRDALYTKEVVLNIQNPAPYEKWNEINNEILKEASEYHDELANNRIYIDDSNFIPKTFHKQSRSYNDELRYRLQDEGYDGIHADGKPTINTKELEETGKTKFKSVSGRTKYIMEKNDGEYQLKYSDGEYITSYESVDEYLDQQEEIWVAFSPEQIKVINRYHKRK